MGLAVSVGVLSGMNDEEGRESLLQDFERINRALAAEGLPLHREPASVPKLLHRNDLVSFPYRWLHCLRRAVAFARQAPEEFCPLAEGEDVASDPRIDTELFVRMDSHLICHSDCEGLYVPIDFSISLYDDELPGGCVGSSQRALAEVLLAAPLLSIPLVGGKLADEVAGEIAQAADGSHPYWIERQVWLTMYESFRHSIEHKCAVVFT